MSENIALTIEQKDEITSYIRQRQLDYENCVNDIVMFGQECYEEGTLEQMEATRDSLQKELCGYFDMLNPSLGVWLAVRADWVAMDEKNMQDPKEKNRTLKFIDGLIDSKRKNTPIVDPKRKMRALNLLFTSIPTVSADKDSIAAKQKSMEQARKNKIEIPKLVPSKDSEKVVKYYGFWGEYPCTVGGYLKKLNKFIQSGTERLDAYQLSQIAFIAGAAVFCGAYNYCLDFAKTTKLTNAQKYGIELFGRDIHKVQSQIIPILYTMGAQAEINKKQKEYVPNAKREVFQIVNKFISNYNIWRVCGMGSRVASCSEKTRTDSFCKKCTLHKEIDGFYQMCEDPKNKEQLLSKNGEYIRLEVLDLLPNNLFFESVYNMVNNAMEGHILSRQYFVDNILNPVKELGGSYIIAPAINLYTDAIEYDDRVMNTKEKELIQVIEARVKQKTPEINAWYNMLDISAEFLEKVNKKTK